MRIHKKEALDSMTESASSGKKRGEVDLSCSIFFPLGFYQILEK
jgi:hypothetical protein